MSESVFDAIVVGSGCTGAMAAQTLLERGYSVLMLDGGNDDQHYRNLTPESSFTELRQTDTQQHRYLLGEQFESLPAAQVGTGAQLTPARAHLLKDVTTLLASQSKSFAPMETLALGGLGAGWGLGSCVFSEKELEQCSLPVEAMQQAYQVVADRIGISGDTDDAQPFTFRHLQHIQPALPTDAVAQKITARYGMNRSQLQQRHFHLGRPALALLSQDKHHRKGNALRDMEFYDDKELSAYRPWITIRELQRQSNFKLEQGWLVTKFEETDDGVVVHAVHIESKTAQQFRARKLVLCSGALGTARIALRSSEQKKRVPLLCNPYYYLPCLVPSMLGQAGAKQQYSYAQLSLFHDNNAAGNDIAMASLYTYRSLMLFRLLNETPLNIQDGRALIQYLAPALLIAGIHLPEHLSEGQYAELLPAADSITGDRMHYNYKRTSQQERDSKDRVSAYKWALRKLGAFPLKTVAPEIGASIHYAGTLPFSATQEHLTLKENGLLHGTKNVYVADGSGFTFLPAKGLTLTLMANAHRVASGV
jgi:choline dehydrogenase-like flavoprotein